MSDHIYDDYTDEEIAAMEREFDAWLRWRDTQRFGCLAPGSVVEIAATVADAPRLEDDVSCRIK